MTEPLPGTPGRPARIGLFGGTFDPPHVGHLVTAVNVRHALDLDVVDPDGRQRALAEGGRAGAITPAEDRLAMVEAAVADVAGLEAGRLEIDLGGPSYTADTLAALAERAPRRRAVHDRRRRRRRRPAHLGALRGGRRPLAAGRRRPARASRCELPDDVDWIRVEVPRLEVSSTDLRARFTDGRPLDYLVTDPVLDGDRAARPVREEPAR